MKTFSVKTLASIFIVLSVSMLSSCGGGGAKNENYSTTTTVGQELTDLNKAHADGVISDSEYESAKKKILNRKN